MDRATHVLAFHVHDVQYLRDAFGETAVSAGLADAKSALEKVVPQLRGRNRAAHIPTSTKAHRWLCGIEMIGIGTALVDASEQEASLSAAAHAAMRRALIDVFGAGTGSRIRFAAVVLPLPRASASDLDAWLDREIALDDETRDDDANEDRVAVDAIVAGHGLRTFVQPIVALRTGEVVGYEALTRGPEGSRLESASELFGAAARSGRTRELELACARQALKLAPLLPESRWLSINLGLGSFASDGVVDSLTHPRVALEITEHLPLDQAQHHRPLFDRVRKCGVPIVLDDTGCGFADARAVQAIRPDIVKLCITITRNADRGSSFLDEIAETIAEFRNLGAEVLAEGVETAEQAHAMLAVGATLAQGWYFGRPVAAQEVLVA